MKNNKKVLFVATITGHINAFHLPYMKLFKDNDYKVYVASGDNKEVKDFCDEKIIVPIQRSPYKLSNLKAIKELKKIINKEKFDIIHCHTPMGAVVARLAAKQARKKYRTRVIYTAHGLHFYKGAPLKNWLLFYPVEWYLAKYTDTLITINQEDFEFAKRKFSKRCKDIQYVPGVGIDTKKFDIKLSDKEKKDFKKSLGLKKDDYVLTCVARLDKNKNQGFLIDVVEELIKNNKNIHLLLVGSDELNGYYQKIVKEKKLDNNIHFLGRREDIPEILSITDIVLSASKREGLPVNVMEAFAAGKPVVALNCRGMKDLIEDGENGYIIDNSIKKITNIILYLKTNLEIINTIYNNNIKKSDQCSINKLIKKYNDIYFKKKKILHILSTNKFSGAENVVCTIIKYFEDEFNMAYCSPNGSIYENLLERKIKYYPLKKLNYVELKRIIDLYNPDIIHAHDNRATVIASFFSKKCKIISHIHGNNLIMRKLNFKSLLFNFCSRKISKFIWVSDSSLNDYYFKNNVKSKSVILYNIINKSDIIKKSTLYECDEKYDLIFIGRLGFPKNVQRLIKIIKLAKIKKDNIKVAIVGDGPEKEIIIKLINKYKLNKNIKMYGFKSNPFPILKNSKILIMTSIYEGTPMCSLEAQALCKPVIATPVDGLKKIIINDYNGYLSNNNEELVNVILKYLEDGTLKKLNKNIKNNFKKINNEKEYFKKLKKIYYEKGRQ